jgi:hypothetical protein
VSLDMVRPWNRPDSARSSGGVEVRHACPECPLGRPQAACACCGGHGLVTDKRIAEWQLLVGGAVIL